MSTLWVESIPVGDVRDLVGVTVDVGVAKAATYLQGLVVGTNIVEMTFLLSLNTVTGLVIVAVGTVGVGTVQSLFENGDWSSIVDGGGDCHGHESVQSDYQWIHVEKKDIFYFS